MGGLGKTLLFAVLLGSAILNWGCAAHHKGNLREKRANATAKVVIKKAEGLPLIPPEALVKPSGNLTGEAPISPVGNASALNGTNASQCPICVLKAFDDYPELRDLEYEINSQWALLDRLQDSFHRFMVEMDRPEVERFVEEYLDSEINRPRFMRHLKRASALVGMAKGVLREEGMPTALAYLPIIESGYQASIRSRSHAVGYWQFVASTARKYGLRIGRWVDERRDIERSTRAAARYLRELYGLFGSWDLALAAYNGGEGRIFRAIARGDADDFWSLRESGELRRESSDYVPRFLAVLKILAHADDYGVQPLRDDDPTFYKMVVPGGIALSTIAQWAGIREETLRRLNPAVLRWRVPPFSQGYLLRFPSAEAVAMVEANLKRRSKMRRIVKRAPLRHRIRKGETLSDLALRYGVSVSAIMSYNGITNPRRIRPGRVIYIPPRRDSSS